MADSYTITDNRTGKSVEVPIENGGISSRAFRELDPNIFIYDPAFLQTAACRSSITYLDGDNGILRYRGYPIQELAEQSSYLEVAYLIVHGELPSPSRPRRRWRPPPGHRPPRPSPGRWPRPWPRRWAD